MWWLGRGGSVEFGEKWERDGSSGDVRLLFLFVPFRLLHVVKLEEACCAWPISVSFAAVMEVFDFGMVGSYKNSLASQSCPLDCSGISASCANLDPSGSA